MASISREVVIAHTEPGTSIESHLEAVGCPNTGGGVGEGGGRGEREREKRGMLFVWKGRRWEANMDISIRLSIHVYVSVWFRKEYLQKI